MVVYPGSGENELRLYIFLMIQVQTCIEKPEKNDSQLSDEGTVPW